jgi:hypothetical protein
LFQCRSFYACLNFTCRLISADMKQRRKGPRRDKLAGAMCIGDSPDRFIRKSGRRPCSNSRYCLLRSAVTYEVKIVRDYAQEISAKQARMRLSTIAVRVYHDEQINYTDDKSSSQAHYSEI